MKVVAQPDVMVAPPVVVPDARQGVVQAAERHAVQVAALAVAVVAAANPVILSHSNANNVN